MWPGFYFFLFSVLFFYFLVRLQVLCSPSVLRVLKNTFICTAFQEFSGTGNSMCAVSPMLPLANWSVPV